MYIFITIGNLYIKFPQCIDLASFKTEDLEPGETPSVLAMSWGKGDPHKDSITLVFLDEAGRLREQTKVDNLSDTDSRDEFFDLLRRRRPDVIAISRFSMATTKLSLRVKELIYPQADDGMNVDSNEIGSSEFSKISVTYVLDDIARLYQHSKRAAEEFTSLTPIAKYCVSLARYI